MDMWWRRAFISMARSNGARGEVQHGHGVGEGFCSFVSAPVRLTSP